MFGRAAYLGPLVASAAREVWLTEIDPLLFVPAVEAGAQPANALVFTAPVLVLLNEPLRPARRWP